MIARGAGYWRTSVAIALLCATASGNAQLVFDPAVLGPPQGDGFVEQHFDPVTAPAQDATVALTLPNADTLPWGEASSLKMHVQNAMAWPLTLVLGLVGKDGHMLSASVALPPGPPLTLVLPLAATLPRAWGMRAAPPQPFNHEGEPLLVASTVTGDRAADPTLLTLTIPAPDSRQTLRVGKVFLESARDDEPLLYTGIIDCYGQAARAQWSGKPACDSKLENFSPVEASTTRTLSVDGRAIDRDRYGGLRLDPALASRLANGFFKVWKQPAVRDRPARWWLLSPEGNPFFSLGVNAVQRDNSSTFIEGREFMFDPLPLADRSLSRFRGNRDSTEVLAADAGAQRHRNFLRGETFDFYRANLFRRDGNDFDQAWRKRAEARLLEWQFNTAGAWSDEASFTKVTELPYTAIIHVEGDFARLSDGNDWWQGVADPFDPRFARAVRDSLAKGTVAHRGERRLIGFFVDNEPGFGDGGSRDPRIRYALALAALAGDGRDANAYAKRAFVAMLATRHESPAALAQTWQWQWPQPDTGSSTESIDPWAALMLPWDGTQAPDARHPAVTADLLAFQALHADQWFRTIAQALREADPDHLYLGSRFAGRTPEAVAACAQWCDVVSFNLYVPDIASGFEAREFARFDKPAMVTEFHFGSADRGPFWPGIMQVASEDDRGPAYARMLESVIANPQFVGAHWFQYIDQPASGRWLDGENGHLGLVDITDAPWPSFVAAVQQANRRTLGSLAATFAR